MIIFLHNLAHRASHLPLDQKIAGSDPARVFLVSFFGGGVGFRTFGRYDADFCTSSCIVILCI
jgi:hypothetical protein